MGERARVVVVLAKGQGHVLCPHPGHGIVPVLLGDVDFHVVGGKVELPHHVVGGEVLV